MTYYVKIGAGVPTLPVPKFVEGLLYYNGTKAYPGETLEVPSDKVVYASGYIKNEGGDGKVQIWAYDKKTSKYITASDYITITAGTAKQGFNFKVGTPPADGWDIELQACHLEDSNPVIDDRLSVIHVKPKGAPPAAPAEATHFMVLKLAALPWVNWDGLKSALSSVVTQAFTKAVNLFGGAVGWQLVGTPALFEPGESTPIGTVPSGQGWVFIYLKKTGSPIAFLAAWATFIVVGIAVFGFVLVAWSLYESATAKKIESETQQQIIDDAKELHDKGSISDDEYTKILQNYQQAPAAAPSIYDKIAELLGITPDQAKYLVLGFGALFALAFIKSLLR